MILRVQFKDLTYDYVDKFTLDKLLASRSLRRFYRPFEERWVYVYEDPIRELGDDYSGPERRQPYKIK